MFSLPINLTMPEFSFALSDNKLLQSSLFIIALLAIRFIIVHLIRRNSAILTEGQRHWVIRVKNLTWFIILIGLISTWWPELRNFAFSIAAVALALVIATKELILCFSGALMRAGSGAFTIGDWVEVGPHRGEVIDYNMFSTTLQEFDKTPNNYAFTGKTILIPNSLFLSETVKNLNFSKRYVFHRFDIVMGPNVKLDGLYDWIVTEISTFSSDFIDVAKRYNTFIEKRTGVDIPGAEPRIMISTNELAKHVITVIIFCPSERATELEQHITWGVLRRIYQREIAK